MANRIIPPDQFARAIMWSSWEAAVKAQKAHGWSDEKTRRMASALMLNTAGSFAG